MIHTERIAVVHVDACVPHGFTLIGLYLCLRGGVRRPERGIAGSRGAAGGFLEGAMDHRRRLADDASRVAEDELAESSGRSDLLLSSRHLHDVQRNIDYFMISWDLVHRIESVELSRGPLRPHSQVCLQFIGTSSPPACANLCAASKVAPGWAQAPNMCSCLS